MRFALFSRLFIVGLIVALLGGKVLGDIRWRSLNGGPKTGVAGVVNLPSASCAVMNSGAVQSEQWDGWRGLQYSQDAMLKLPANMPRAVLLMTCGGVMATPAIVDGIVSIPGQDLAALRDSNVTEITLKFVNATHVMECIFKLDATSRTYSILAR